MADENDNKPIQTPESERQTAPAPKPSVAEGADGKTAEAVGKAADFGGTEKDMRVESGPVSKDKDKNAGKSASEKATADTDRDVESSKAFQLLDKALKGTDWGWKNKTGDDRELGRLTYVNAQNAWVEAAVEDPKRATTIWFKNNRRNPSSEMEQNLADRMKTIGEAGKKAEGSGNNLDKVTADIGELSKRRGLSENKTRKTALNSSLGEWHIMRGDSQQRAEQAKRARSNELWSPEPDKNQDGMHLLKSFFKGYATHREAVQKKVANHKAKMAGKVIGEIRTELGKVSTEIKKFETELDVPMDERDTSGVVGRSRKAVANNSAFRLGKGTATIVAKVSKKVAEKGAEVAKGVAIQGAALASNPGTIDGNAGVASYQSRMAAFNQFQRGRAGAGPS